jgi:hypothetical protein
MAPHTFPSRGTVLALFSTYILDDYVPLQLHLDEKTASNVSHMSSKSLRMRRAFLLHEEEVKGEQAMTIKEAIEKAVKGGYHLDGSDGMGIYDEGAHRDFSAGTRTENASTCMVAVKATLLDPQFWQALGKALEWNAVSNLASICVHGEEECQTCRSSYWRYQWHCFLQALVDGHTPEAFFARLASSQLPRKQRA